MGLVLHARVITAAVTLVRKGQPLLECCCVIAERDNQEYMEPEQQYNSCVSYSNSCAEPSYTYSVCTAEEKEIGFPAV